MMERGHREALRIEFPSFQTKIHLLSEMADHLEYDIADPANSGLDAGKFVTEMARLIERAYPTICEFAQGHKMVPSGSGRSVNVTL